MDVWWWTGCLIIEIRCPKIKSIHNGTVMLSDRTIGGTINYTCDSGYILYGPATRNCTNQGSWTGINPSCISKHLVHIIIHMYRCYHIVIIILLYSYSINQTKINATYLLQTCSEKSYAMHLNKCVCVRVYYMRTWESVVCVHVVIFRGHTRFLAQALSSHFNSILIILHIIQMCSLHVQAVCI